MQEVGWVRGQGVGSVQAVCLAVYAVRRCRVFGSVSWCRFGAYAGCQRSQTVLAASVFRVI